VSVSRAYTCLQQSRGLVDLGRKVLALALPRPRLFSLGQDQGQDLHEMTSRILEANWPDSCCWGVLTVFKLWSWTVTVALCSVHPAKLKRKISRCLTTYREWWK